MSATSLRSQQAASKKEFESFVEDLHVALARPTATHGGRVSVCVCVSSVVYNILHYVWEG